MEGDNRSAWTSRMVFWNTVGTVLGAVFGAAALLISVSTLVITLK